MNASPIALLISACVFIGLAQTVVEAVSFTKSPPAIIGSERSWQFITGFQALTEHHILGKGKDSWYGSTDAGGSWNKIFVGKSNTIRNDVTAVVIQNGVAHNFGSIPKVNGSKLEHFFSFNSSFTTFFLYDEITKQFKFSLRSQSILFTGIPEPGVTCGNSKMAYGCPFRTGGRGVVELVENGKNVFVQSIIVYMNGEKYANPRPELKDYATTVIAFRSSDGGFTWNYAGVILAASAVPQSEEGPNENDLVVLKDGKTILSVIRLDAGDGYLTHRYAPYVTVKSTDGGFTWSKPTELPNTVGCARPRLLLLGSTLVLSGGRLSPTNRDILIWTDENGDGKQWRQQSVSYIHNELSKNNSAIPKFTSLVNNSESRQSTSYTSLLRTGSRSGIITYGIIINKTGTAFSMAFEV